MIKFGFLAAIPVLAFMGLVMQHVVVEQAIGQRTAEGALEQTNYANILQATGDTVVPKKPAAGDVKKDDAFARLMAGVVNDTAILYDNYVEETPARDSMVTALLKKPAKDSVKTNGTGSTALQAVKKPGGEKPVVVKDSMALVKNNVAAPAHKRPGVHKFFEHKTVAGIELRYALVQRDGTTDTINVSIPAGVQAGDLAVAGQSVKHPDKAMDGKVRNTPDSAAAVVKSNSPAMPIADSTQKKNAVAEKKTNVPMDTARKAVASTENKQLSGVGEGSVKKNMVADKKTAEAKNDSLRYAEEAQSNRLRATDSLRKSRVVPDKPVVAATNDSSATGAAATEKKPVNAAPAFNSNCKLSATDYDVDKLRVKMMAVDSDDDKLQVARKFFRLKCFTTNQVRALSEVFPTDEGRYKLFDTAYPFVSDYGNYPQLANLLTGQYFINRFKAMLRQ